MKKDKILKALNQKILLFQKRRKEESLRKSEDISLLTYIMAYQEVEKMIIQDNPTEFLNSEHIHGF